MGGARGGCGLLWVGERQSRWWVRGPAFSSSLQPAAAHFNSSLLQPAPARRGVARMKTWTSDNCSALLPPWLTTVSWRDNVLTASSARAPRVSRVSRAARAGNPTALRLRAASANTCTALGGDRNASTKSINRAVKPNADGAGSPWRVGHPHQSAGSVMMADDHRVEGRGGPRAAGLRHHLLAERGF